MARFPELVRTWNRNPLFLPGVVLVAILGVVHAILPITSDDALNIPTALSQTWGEWLSFQFNHFSSRFIIDTISWPLYHVFDGWRVLNVVAFALLYVYFTKLFSLDRTRSTAWLGALAVLALPFGAGSSAGYLATSITYYWPMAAGVVAGYGAKRALMGERIKPLHTVGYLLALLFAVDQEQSNVFMTGMLLFVVGYVLIARRRRPPLLLVAMTGLGLARLAMALAAPGPAQRELAEIPRFFPDMRTVDVFYQLQMGFTPTFASTFARPDRIVLAFTAALCVTVWMLHRDRFFRLIGVAPLLVALLSGWAVPLAYLTSFTFPRLSTFGGLAERRYLINLRTFDNLANYIPILLFGAAFFCLLVASYLCFENRRSIGWLSVGLLAAGFASRLAVGFSPTAFASGERTFTYTYFALIAVLYMLMQRVRTLRPHYSRYLLGTMGVLAFASIWVLVNDAIALR